MVTKKYLTITEIQNILSQHKKLLADKYCVSEIGVFGSYVRGSQTKKSDIDILVEFTNGKEISLLDFIKLKNYLSILLNTRVDLVEKTALKPRIGKHILEEVVTV